MGTMKDPSPQDLAKCWKELAGDEIDAETLASLVAAIRQWPTGRLATAAGRKSPAIIVSWQKVDGSMYVTMPRGTGSWWLHGRIACFSALTSPIPQKLDSTWLSAALRSEASEIRNETAGCGAIVVNRNIETLFQLGVLAGTSDGQLLERFASRRPGPASSLRGDRQAPRVDGALGLPPGVGDRHAAEDAFQATFLVLALRAHAVRRRESLGPWLHGVAARVARRCGKWNSVAAKRRCPRTVWPARGRSTRNGVSRQRSSMRSWSGCPRNTAGR